MLSWGNTTMRYKINIQNFAPAMAKVTINFDSNITKVVLTIDEQIYEWTTSGQESDYLALFDGTDYTFEVTLNDGYVLDTVTLLGNEQQGTLKSKTDNSFIITAGSGAIGNIALTSKQVTPTTGTIKFGSANPTKYYLENKAVDRIYMGTVLLYKKAIVYTITANLANCTANSDNPITIEENGGAILYYTANEGYELPDGVELTNVGSYNWDKATGKLVIARPSGNVTIKIVAKQSMPQLATPQNVAVENTTLSFDEVENATEYEIFVDNVSIGSYQVSKGETWVLNETINLSTQTFTTNFVSNGQNFNSLKLTNTLLEYDTTPVYAKFVPEGGSNWVEGEAYRTITFATPPTGDLLTWLQANGVKQ